MIEFIQAQGINDIKASVRIAQEHFGVNAYSYQKRIAWYNRFPDGDYILKDNGIIVGYFSMQTVKAIAIKRIFANQSSLRLSDIKQLQQNLQNDIYISGIAVTTSVNQSTQKKYGMRLICGIRQMLLNLQYNNNRITIWGKSSTYSGIKLCRNLKLQELGLVNNDQFGFYIEVDKFTR